MKSVLDIQTRLKELGYDPGPTDGIRGRMTINAVKRFQAAMHLTADGIVGPNTLRALFGGAQSAPEDSPDATPWLDLAYRKKGMHETVNNASLRAFLKSDGGTVGDPAKIPWCGDFVETCIALTLPDEVLPQNPYSAINWLKFGKETSPKKGAILVFWRGSPTGWQGHIGFYVGEESGYFHVLGGNQSDSVTITKIAKSRLRAGGCRWPLTALDIDTSAVLADGSHLIETKNEE
jgi:uncharacterized protein (TIGR02594 family)